MRSMLLTLLLTAAAVVVGCAAGSMPLLPRAFFPLRGVRTVKSPNSCFSGLFRFVTRFPAMVNQDCGVVGGDPTSRGRKPAAVRSHDGAIVGDEDWNWNFLDGQSCNDYNRENWVGIVFSWTAKKNSLKW